MKLLKVILYAVIGIVTLFLIVALLLPSQVRVERAIVIEQPVEVVYSLVSDFGNYKKWNPWSKKDPAAKGKLSGNPGEAGQRWSWEGELVGKGYMSLEEAIPNKMIKSKLKFLQPFEAESWDIWSFEPTSGGTKVTWANEADLDYPVGRYFGLFYDGIIGPDFEKGLENLRSLALGRNGKSDEVIKTDSKIEKMKEKKAGETEESELLKRKAIDPSSRNIIPKGPGRF